MEAAPEVTVLDWTLHEPDPPPRLVRAGAPRYRPDPHGRVFVRSPATIDGICLHQTACTFGPSGDAEKRHERAFGIPIHAVAFNDGVVVRPYPPLWYLYHGNAWNSRSLGLEIEGHFAGREDDPTTVPQREDLETYDGHDGTPSVLTPLLLATARRAVLELVERGRAAGCPIRYVWAHRQSAGDRRADPGEAIWRHVGLEYAVAELGLIPQEAVHLRDGFTIPVEWDPAGVGHY